MPDRGDGGDGLQERKWQDVSDRSCGIKETSETEEEKVKLDLKFQKSEEKNRKQKKGCRGTQGQSCTASSTGHKSVLLLGAASSVPAPLVISTASLLKLSWLKMTKTTEIETPLLMQFRSSHGRVCVVRQEHGETAADGGSLEDSNGFLMDSSA